MEKKQYFILIFDLDYCYCLRIHKKDGMVLENYTTIENGNKTQRELMLKQGAKLESDGLYNDGIIILSLPLSQDADWLATVEF